MSLAPSSPAGLWSAGDLDAQPEDGYRREVVEGALLVSPPPAFRHQRISYRLARMLEASLPTGLVAVEAVGVRLPGGSLVIPDCVVVDEVAALADPAGTLDAGVLRLAVEIVSPGSTAQDRVLKPVLYARAGIPSYWRLEPDGGLALHVYRLEAGVYAYAGCARPAEPHGINEPFLRGIDPAALS